MEIDGFSYITREDVLAEIDLPTLTPSARNTALQFSAVENTSSEGLQRVVDMPMYRGEATLRHANALQLTADNLAPAARLSANTIAAQQLQAGQDVSVINAHGNGGKLDLPLTEDSRVPDGCVYIPAGFSVSTAIGNGALGLSQDDSAGGSAS